MKMRKRLLWWSLVLGLGCSASKPAIDSITTESLFIQLAFSRSLLSQEERLVGLVRSADRATILNPTSGEEVFHLGGNGFTSAYPTPDNNGFVLKGDNSIRVVDTAGGSIGLTSETTGRFSLASGALAYAYVDHTNVTLLRQKSDNSWQNSTYRLAFSATDNTGYDQPPATISVWSDNGQKLLVFGPSNGWHSLYEASDSSANVTSAGKDCEGDSIGTQTDASYWDAIWWQNKGLFIFGSKDGKILAFDPTNSCSDLANLPLLDLGNSFPIRKLIAEGDTLLVLQAGQVTKVNWSGSFSQDSLVEKTCNYPTLAATIPNSRTLVRCVADTNVTTPITSYVITATGEIGWQFNIYNASGSNLSQISMGNRSFSSMTVDTENQRLYVLLNSSFGSLLTWDLVSFAESRKTGMFLKRIFD